MLVNHVHSSGSGKQSFWIISFITCWFLTLCNLPCRGVGRITGLRGHSGYEVHINYQDYQDINFENHMSFNFSLVNNKQILTFVISTHSFTQISPKSPFSLYQQTQVGNLNEVKSICLFFVHMQQQNVETFFTHRGSEVSLYAT